MIHGDFVQLPSEGVTVHVTVTPDLRMEVSRRIREEFENGRDYYALHGRTLNVPELVALQPHSDHLTWHNESVFRG